MVNFSFPPEFEPNTPVEYDTLDPNNLEKVLRGEIFPAGRRVVDSNTFLLELDADEVSRSRRLFEDDETHTVFSESYRQSSDANEAFVDLFLENPRDPSKIQHSIRLFNQLIEQFAGDDAYNAEMRTSLEALKRKSYEGNEDDLRARADQLTELVSGSELELWVIARKNFRNKDAIAARLHGAGVVKFGKGKALRPLVVDKNGEVGTLPRAYYIEPRLHTPVPADKL